MSFYNLLCNFLQIEVFYLPRIVKEDIYVILTRYLVRICRACTQNNPVSYPLSVISYQLSVISYQLSIISYQLSVIRYQVSVISNQ